MDPLKSILLGDGEPSKGGHITDDLLRAQILEHSKTFKTSWVKLGQALYAVWNDKMYKLWGFEKFEYYTEKEIGLKKQVALKLLKTYFFLEHEEPSYLKEDYLESTEAAQVPGYETVNVLRLAKNKKELPREEFVKLKTSVFEKGKDAVTIRKDLTALMKQREELDPDEEREKRNVAAVRRLLTAYRSFKKDMETLKLLPATVLKQTEDVMSKLEMEIK